MNVFSAVAPGYATPGRDFIVLHVTLGDAFDAAAMSQLIHCLVLEKSCTSYIAFANDPTTVFGWPQPNRFGE